MTFTILTVNHRTIVDTLSLKEVIVEPRTIDLIGFKCVQIKGNKTKIITQKDIRILKMVNQVENPYGTLLVMNCELYSGQHLELKFSNHGKYQLLNPDIQFLSVTGQEYIPQPESWWYTTDIQWDYMSTKIKSK